MLGVSGISSDARDVAEAAKNGNEQAKITQALYVNRVINVVGGYAMQLGHVDAIVFTAGLGENDTYIRQEILKHLEEGLSLQIDYELNKNTRSEKKISLPGSKAEVFVIPTNEELMIARDTVRILGL